MARVRGSISFSSSYEATISKPMDARLLVPSYADLLDNSNWLTSKNTPCCYNGMLVAVANTSDTSKNGLYMLFDATSSRKPDVTKEENWIKIGETSDITDLVTRVSSIESDLLNITKDITSLDERVEALEDQDHVHTFGCKKDFPNPGTEGHVYVAADERKTYVCVSGGSYVLVGAGFEEDENGVITIDGGDADVDGDN